MKQISLDTEVSVRLTDKGADQLIKNAKIATKYDYHFDQHGNLCIKLIGLMHIFGEDVDKKDYFYGDSFTIDEKGIEEYNPKVR